MSIEITSTTESPEAVAAALSSLAKKDSDIDKKTESELNKNSDENTESTRGASQKSDDQEVEKDSDDQEDDDQIENEEDSKPKKKGGFKKRIERFQKQLSQKDQELEYWKQKAIAADPGKKESEIQISGKNSEDSLAKPKAENFDTHEEFVDALTDWKIQQRESQKEAKVKADAAKSDYQKQIEAFQNKVAEFKKGATDFDDAIEDVDDIILSSSFQQTLLSSEQAPQLIYELAKNRKELERINSLDPVGVAREIGKLEAKLELKTSSKQEIKTTKAPAPLSTVGSRSSGSIAKSIHDPNISFADYERLRMQELNRKNK